MNKQNSFSYYCEQHANLSDYKKVSNKIN